MNPIFVKKKNFIEKVKTKKLPGQFSAKKKMSMKKFPGQETKNFLYENRGGWMVSTRIGWGLSFSTARVARVETSTLRNEALMTRAPREKKRTLNKGDEKEDYVNAEKEKERESISERVLLLKRNGVTCFIFRLRSFKS